MGFARVVMVLAVGEMEFGGHHHNSLSPAQLSMQTTTPEMWSFRQSWQSQAELSRESSSGMCRAPSS